MHLLWTRGLDDWEQDRHLFKKENPIIRLPCVKSTSVPINNIKNIEAFFSQEKTACIFTSSKAVTYSLKNKALLEILEKKSHAIYVLGNKTRKSLEHFGLDACHHQEFYYGKDLGEYLLKESEPSLQFFLPGPKERAFNFKALFENTTHKTFLLNSYETVKGVFNLKNEPCSSFLDLNIDPQLIKNAVICFASPSAVDGFLKGRPDHEAVWTKKPRAMAIGKTTLVACRVFKKHFLAPQTSLKSLVASALELLNCLL